MLKRVLLCLLCLALILPAACAEERPTLRIAADYLNELYEGYPGAQLQLVENSNGMDDMATAFATQNDQIDLFIFWAPSGLFSVKRHGYFAPLNGSEALMSKLDDLYPAFRDALTTDDGQLVGWVMGADILGMYVYADVLDEAELAMPQTFDELLDTCEALADSDVVPSGMTLCGDTPYTRQGMLDLYMDQYIRASQLQGGTVDFTDPDFEKMAQRIRDTLPEMEPPMGEEDYGMGVFNIPMGYNTPDREMLPMLQVLPGKDGIVETSMSVAVINPYSPNKEAAIAYLEWCAAQVSPESCVYDASLTEPMKDKWTLDSIEQTKASIAALEAAEELTVEQQDELEDLRQQLASLENSWAISPEAIAAYAAIAGGLSVNEASPVTYDNVLRTAAERYLNGAFDAAGFAKECQDHITIIYEEYGIPMK